MASPLDTWLPDPSASFRHSRASTAAPADLWEAALRLRISETPTMRRLIRWRLGKHAPGGDTTYRDLFRSGIFTLLEEGDRFSVSGVAGRIWTPSGNYAQFESPAEYRQWHRSGTAKVALMTEVVEHPRGSQLVSEARIHVDGRRTRVVFRGFWALVSPFTHFVHSEVHAAAVRRAES